jgi:molybdate transport system ATP-binding protein
VELRVQVEKRFENFAVLADFAAGGERLGVFGESGSGKSTLVGLIAGLHEPDRGEIVLDGQCLFNSRQRVNVPSERRNIAIVFQQPSLFPHLNVRSNLLYGYKRRAVAERGVDLASVVEVLQLDGLLARGVNNLSGGEKQRVALGRAVLASPRLLLMDEPLSALGDGLKFQIIPFLRNVSDRFRIPFLFISHSLVEMRLMAERVLVVADGRIEEEMTTDALARARMGLSPVGYINLLRLSSPRPIEGMFAYRWGAGELLISAGNAEGAAIFELSSKDIILFKQHPEATSARNLLECTVVDLFPAGNRIGAELACGDQRLVAEMTQQAARELGVVRDGHLFAAIKASAFRRLG